MTYKRTKEQREKMAFVWTQNMKDPYKLQSNLSVVRTTETWLEERIYL